MAVFIQTPVYVAVSSLGILLPGYDGYGWFFTNLFANILAVITLIGNNKLR
jgi:hypothetical protein